MEDWVSKICCKVGIEMERGVVGVEGVKMEVAMEVVVGIAVLIGASVGNARKWTY